MRLWLTQVDAARPLQPRPAGGTPARLMLSRPQAPAGPQVVVPGGVSVPATARPSLCLGVSSFLLGLVTLTSPARRQELGIAFLC